MDHRLWRFGTYHLPFESMLLSGLSGSLFQQTILPEGLDPRRYVAPEQWRYFKPRAPGSLQLNQPGYVEFLTQSFKDNLSLQVRIDRQPRGGETFWPRVEIINRNPTPLRSGFAEHYHLTLSYSWIKDGKRIENPTDHTPLGIDVETAYTQYMKVRAPGTPGPYDLRVDLWLEKAGWLDVEVVVPLQVR